MERKDVYFAAKESETHAYFPILCTNFLKSSDLGDAKSECVKQGHQGADLLGRRMWALPRVRERLSAQLATHISASSCWELPGRGGVTNTESSVSELLHSPAKKG